MVNIVKNKRPSTYIIEVVERTSFFKIFFLWFSVIIFFGFLYFALTNYTLDNYLMSSDGSRIGTVVESIYYSFITATSTGYGDIVPRGYFARSLAIIEVIVGLMMLAVITSKLVALKQENLLEKIYHLSFSEKINRIISNFHLFGHNMDSLLFNMKTKKFDQKNLFSLSHHITKLEQNINDMEKMFFSEDKSGVTKNINTTSIFEIMTGLKKSLLKIRYVLKVSNESELMYKRKSLSRKIIKICDECEKILNEVKSTYPELTDKIKATKANIREIRVFVLNLKLKHKKLQFDLELSPELIMVPETVIAESID